MLPSPFLRRAAKESGLLANAKARRILLELSAAIIVAGAFSALALGVGGAFGPLSQLTAQPISLDPAWLPYYSVRTVLRMAGAMIASLFFTFTYGTIAAKSWRAGVVLIPLLDILQSVPILGYISFTVVLFMSLFPGRVLGAELAAMFAIFTSQAWNMTFSFYQSLRTVPAELSEASACFRFSPWQRFWRLEVPFAVPGLVWNMMMSMSGGWFFVVASEAISVGDRQIVLPGIGSYVATAVADKDGGAIGWAVLAMGVVILIYDQVVFRPLAVWADGFRFEQTAGTAPRSWFLQALRQSRLTRAMLRPACFAAHRLLRERLLNRGALPILRPSHRKVMNIGWYTFLAILLGCSAAEIARRLIGQLDWPAVATAMYLGLITLSRVLILIVLAAVLWVPVGVMVGLRPRVAALVQPMAQFLAAFPVNLLFPVAVLLIMRWRLDPDIWLSPLMILGTQWYLLFNVIAGASAYPTDLLEASAEFRFRPRQWWLRAILPGILPYFVTGAITASGGAWNASIVAEAVSWGQTRLSARGLGAYIAQMTEAGDYPHIILGIAVMSLFVIILNRLVWHPLYAFAERRSRLG